MEKNFFACYKSQSHSFKVKCVFMHDKAPSHISKLIYGFFEHKRFTGGKIIEWPLPTPDRNPIKNQWSLVKRKLHKGDKQYKSKADQWETIKTTISEIEFAKIESINKTTAE